MSSIGVMLGDNWAGAIMLPAVLVEVRPGADSQVFHGLTDDCEGASFNIAAPAGETPVVLPGIRVFAGVADGLCSGWIDDGNPPTAGSIMTPSIGNG